MEEGEQKLCLVEPTLELVEETPLQVQVQLMEKMEGGEALVAEAALEEEEGSVLCLPLILIQQEMEEVAELAAMEAVAEAAAEEGASILVAAILQEQEVQQELVVLEAEAEAADMLGLLTQEIVVVMVQQEVMAEVEGVEAAAKLVMVAAALAALD